MTAFKWASNLNPDTIMHAFGHGAWSGPKKGLGLALGGLFYLNLPRFGPQLIVLAKR
jgi:hypothetical protein